MTSARDRLDVERNSLAVMIARATPPESVSPMIPIAPARGPAVVAPQFETEIIDGKPVRTATTFAGAHPVRVADVFDLMRLQANKRGGGSTLTRAQEGIGRDYTALVERCASGGVKGSSFEPTISGGGGAGGYSEAVLQDFADLRAMRIKIGDGAALVAVNARAHADRARVGVKVQYLVDQVCLADWPLSRVLVRCGWSASSRNIAALRKVLAETLDRMGGVEPIGNELEASDAELAVRSQKMQKED